MVVATSDNSRSLRMKRLSTQLHAQKKRIKRNGLWYASRRCAVKLIRRSMNGYDRKSLDGTTLLRWATPKSQKKPRGGCPWLKDRQAIETIRENNALGREEVFYLEKDIKLVCRRMKRTVATPAVPGHKTYAEALEDAKCDKVEFWKALKEVREEDPTAKLKQFPGKRKDGYACERTYVPDEVLEKILVKLRGPIVLDRIPKREANKLLGGKEGGKDCVNYYIETGRPQESKKQRYIDKNGVIRRGTIVSRNAVLALVKEKADADMSRTSKQSLENQVKALKEILAHGPLPSTRERILTKKMRAMGFRDYSEARKKAGVRRFRKERGGVWYNALPHEPLPQPDVSLLTFGDGYFDLLGQRVPLRPCLLQLLRFFWRYRGIEVTLQTIKEKVFHWPTTSDEQQESKEDASHRRTVRDHIQELRDTLRGAMKAAGIKSPRDPIPHTDISPDRKNPSLSHYAWCLDLLSAEAWSNALIC